MENFKHVFIMHRPSMTVTRHRALTIPKKGDILSYGSVTVRVLHVTFLLAKSGEESSEHSIYVEVEPAEEATFEYQDVEDLDPSEFFDRLQES